MFLILLYAALVLSVAYDILLVRAVTSALALFLIPGLCWLKRLWGSEIKPALVLVLSFFLSVLLSISALLFYKISPLPLNIYYFLCVVFMISLAGLIISGSGGGNGLKRYQLVFITLVVLVLGRNALTMPRIIDQDIHFIAPAYGCVYDLKPYTSLSRVPFLFDHSQLPTFMSALSIFAMGDISMTRHFYIQARKIEDSYPPDMLCRLWHAIPGTSEPVEERKLAGKQHLIFSARIPHVIMGALSLLLILELAKERTGSLFPGLLTALLCMSPGLFVRFSSCGWTSSVILMSVSCFYVYLSLSAQARKYLLLFLFGFIGGLINQKTVIPVIAITATEISLTRRAKNSAGLVLGWISGILLVSLYGLLLNWNCFFRAFFLHHGVTGMLEGVKNIPGFFSSWTRSALYMNPVIFIASLASVAYHTFRSRKGLFFSVPVWFWTASMIFVISRWPNARNAVLAYPPLFMSLICTVASFRTAILKKTAYGVIVVLFAVNFIIMYGTFSSPNAFYAENEEGNTPVTVVNEYMSGMKDILFPAENSGANRPLPNTR